MFFERCYALGEKFAGRGFYGHHGYSGDLMPHEFIGRGYFGGFHPLMGLALVILVVVVVLIVRASTKNKRLNYKALELLKMNFAEGKLTEDEYKSKKATLKEK